MRFRHFPPHFQLVAFFPLFPRLQARDWSVTLFARVLFGHDLISVDYSLKVFENPNSTMKKKLLS